MAWSMFLELLREAFVWLAKKLWPVALVLLALGAILMLWLFN